MRTFDTILLTLSLSAAFAIGACGSSDPDSPCTALSACCASLAGSDADACNAAISQSGVTDSVCASALSMFQNLGECKSVGDDAGSAGEAGADLAVDASVVSGCKGLAACCPTLPAQQDPTECVEVVDHGTEQACSASLAGYRAAGLCGADFTVPAYPGDSGDRVIEPDPRDASGGPLDAGAFPTGYEACTSGQKCTLQPVYSPTDLDNVEEQCTAGGGKAASACPSRGLLGCCKTADPETCYYGLDGQELEAIEAVCGVGWSNSP